MSTQPELEREPSEATPNEYTCYLCAYQPEYPRKLHDVGCPHCPCSECENERAVE